MSHPIHKLQRRLLLATAVLACVLTTLAGCDQEDVAAMSVAEQTIGTIDPGSKDAVRGAWPLFW